MLNTILLQAAGAGSGMSSIFMIVALIAIFYFFMIRPQNKRQKKIRDERAALKKGDRVITQGGIYGKIKDIKDNVFVVEVSDGVKISVDKNCIYAAGDPEAAIQDAQMKQQQ